MASIHKSFGKWRVQIRRKGFPNLTEHFETKREADADRKSIRQLRSQLKMLRLTNLAQMSVLNIKPKDLIA